MARTFILPLLFIFVVIFSDLEAQRDHYESDARLLQTIADFTARKKEEKNKQDINKIPGIPWVDYPLYHEIPATSFSCHRVPAVPGMYANVETGCQVYHVCHDGREGDQGASFLCSNGTIFNQKDFACDWWYNVDCGNAQSYYRLNLDPETNPYVPQAHKDHLRKQRLRIVVE